MDDKLTISTFQLFQMFPDQEAARVYLEARRWPQGPVCPVCTKGDRITVREGGFYRCNACGDFDFSVRTGTVMERSHVKLHHWLAAMAMIGQRPEIPSEQLADALGVTPKTAWLLRERIHEAAGDLLSAQLDEPGYHLVPSFEHAYRVGKDGSLWTRYCLGKGGRIGLEWRRLNPGLDGDGYRRATLTGRAGKQSPRKVAPLVCAAFHGPRPQGKECRHLDGVRTNDAATNLCWGTPLENQADRRRHGRAPVRAANGNARLTEAQIRDIRALKGTMRQRDIAAKFGVTQAHVSRIHRGVQWSA